MLYYDSKGRHVPPPKSEYIKAKEGLKLGLMGLAAFFALILIIISLTFGYRLTSSRVALGQAANTKKIQIEEARGKADAAVLLAEAEIERAKGVAGANEIIANSLTDEYIRWLYVDQLDQTEGTIIYIPTEAGLPILEAGRLSE